MKLFAAVAPVALLVGLHARAIAGADIPLDWKVTSHEDMTASVGDTVNFDWSDTHNVFIHPTGTCDTTGAIEVGTEAPASHTFAEAGTVTFARDVHSGSRCRAGQIVTFVVTDAVALAATTTEATAAATATDATATDAGPPAPAPSNGPLQRTCAKKDRARCVHSALCTWCTRPCSRGCPSKCLPADTTACFSSGAPAATGVAAVLAVVAAVAAGAWAL